jgi:hypothetical protein
MAKRDFLQRELFLERLSAWRVNPTAAIEELLISEHIFPLARHVMGRAVWLSREDQDTAISEAVKRCWGAFGTYDPGRHPPFKFFGRICYNERLRAGSLKKEREKRDIVCLDELLFSDSKESSGRMDRYFSCGLSPADFDFRRLWVQIPELSEAHRAVFASAVFGEGTDFNKNLRVARIHKETGLPLASVGLVLAEIRDLIGGRPLEVTEDSIRLRRLRQDSAGQWRELRAGRARRCVCVGGK